MRIFLLFLILQYIILCRGFPQGPPPAACNSMGALGHGSSRLPRTDFEIIAPDSVGPGQTITVELSSDEHHAVRGVFMQVRNKPESTDSLDAVGSWDTTKNARFRLHSCNGRPQIGVSHKEKGIKAVGSLVFMWTAPTTCTEGQILYIRATIVVEFFEWTMVQERPITCAKSGPRGFEFEGAVSPTTTKTPTTQSSTTMPRLTQPPPPSKTTKSTQSPTPKATKPTQSPTPKATKPTQSPTPKTTKPTQSPTPETNNTTQSTAITTSASSVQDTPTTKDHTPATPTTQAPINGSTSIPISLDYSNVWAMEAVRPERRSQYCKIPWAIIPKGYSTTFEMGAGRWRNIFSVPNLWILKRAGSGPQLPFPKMRDSYVFYSTRNLREGEAAVLSAPFGLVGCLTFEITYYTEGDVELGALQIVMGGGDSINLPINNSRWTTRKYIINTIKLTWVLIKAESNGMAASLFAIDDIKVTPGRPN